MNESISLVVFGVIASSVVGLLVCVVAVIKRRQIARAHRVGEDSVFLGDDELRDIPMMDADDWGTGRFQPLADEDDR